MAETQTLPSLSHPFMDGGSSSRHVPSRIHLPPLSIPQPGQRPDFRLSQAGGPHRTPPLPGPPSVSAAQLPPRTYAEESRGVPLSKVLSPAPNSYTPPKPEHPYSPSSPPNSAVDFGRPRTLPQHMLDSRPYDYRQPTSIYASPVERPPHSALPSPASYGGPSYPPPFQPQYRRDVPYESSHPTHGHSHMHPYQQQGYGPPTPAARIEHSGPPPPPTFPQQTQVDRKPVVIEPPRSSYLPQRHEELNYELKVRQQPIAARACGFGERDRRVIDPPPIIQLTVSDQLRGTVDLDELRYSLNVVHCTLWSADGTHEETALVQPDRRATRRLMGQLVASPSVAKDEHDNEGCFFCFPDLSCRTHGKYRLRFVLMRIDPANLHVGGTSPILTEVLSETFTVYTAKDFPGMRPSSALTRALKLQGCNIQVKKGNEKALARKRSAVASDDGEDEDEKSGNKKRR